MSSRKDVAIIGAAGSCGRQLAMQLLSRQILAPSARLQLVARRGGKSEVEILGLKTDLRDAFADTAPHIELIDRPELINADILVMLAGSTVPNDPTLNVDRIKLARKNLEIFRTFAEELGRRNGPPPLVIVQSNPVELGVDVFSRSIDRHMVIGAGANSDTMRFSREVESVGKDVSKRLAETGKVDKNDVSEWQKYLEKRKEAKRAKKLERRQQIDSQKQERIANAKAAKETFKKARQEDMGRSSDDEEQPDSSEIAQDARLDKLFSDPKFAVDPTHPRFKKNSVVNELKRKHRK